MPERPQNPKKFETWANDVSARLRAIERRILRKDELDVLQTFEDGDPLGDTLSINFGSGLRAVLVGDKYIEVTATGTADSENELFGDQYYETTDKASLDITGDIDIRIAASARDWTPLTQRCLVSKLDISTNQRSYVFQLLSTSGILSTSWSIDGTANPGSQVQVDSSSAPTIGDGEILAVRVANAVSVRTTNFYTKATTPSNALAACESNSGWTLLSSHAGAASSIHSGSAPLLVGAFLGSGGGPTALWVGTVYAMVLKNGVDGVTVANPDFYSNSSPFVDGSGNTWTLQS